MDVYEMIDKLMYISGTALEHASGTAVMLAHEFYQKTPDTVHKEVLHSLQKEYGNTGLGFSMVSDIIIGEYLRYALNLIIEYEQKKYPDTPFCVFTACCPITLNMKTGRLFLFDSALCTPKDMRIAIELFDTRVGAFNAVKGLRPEEVVSHCNRMLHLIGISLPEDDSPIYYNQTLVDRYEGLGIPTRYKLCILDITIGFLKHHCEKRNYSFDTNRIDYSAILFDWKELAAVLSDGNKDVLYSEFPNICGNCTNNE